MKAHRKVWLVLLLMTGLACWFGHLAIPQGPTARVKVETDATDIPAMTGTLATASEYDSYFIHENRCELK